VVSAPSNPASPPLATANDTAVRVLPPPDLNLATSPLPSLSNDDKDMLRLLIEEDLSLEGVALSTNLDHVELLAWAARPEIKAYMELHEATRHRALKLQAMRALEETIQTTRDPIEKRRAASVLLRALTASLYPRPSRSAQPPATSDPRPTVLRSHASGPRPPNSAAAASWSVFTPTAPPHIAAQAGAAPSPANAPPPSSSSAAILQERTFSPSRSGSPISSACSVLNSSAPTAVGPSG
jgi:hypothetical protein